MIKDTPNEVIELIYTRDCENWQETLANLKQALKQLQIEEQPQLVVIDTKEQALKYNFFASPTIHVNGIDIDRRGRNISRRGLGVGRPYFYNGQNFTAPPIDLIVAGLRELYYD